jgi:2-polyprenyl-6-methoxyphenol hydroxylase-like FAD-dependent oxidoreductase
VVIKGDPILIVGGGLAGFAAALALGRKGFRVRVLEQAPEFGVIGYGIQLGPVFSMFDRLGITDAVLAQSITPKAVIMIDSVDAGIFVRIPTGASFRERFKRPYIVIHRVDLHRILLDACKDLSNVELMPLSGVAAFENLGDRVRATTEDNRILEGAALIGADGLGSTIRTQMMNERGPRMIGYVAHRTIVPMADVVRRSIARRWYCGRDPAFTLFITHCVAELCSTSSRCLRRQPMPKEAKARATAQSLIAPIAILTLR